MVTFARRATSKDQGSIHTFEAASPSRVESAAGSGRPLTGRESARSWARAVSGFALLCGVALASACGRHSNARAVNSEPAAAQDTQTSWAAGERYAEQESAVEEGGGAPWPAARDSVAQQKSAAPSAQYDTHSPAAAQRGRAAPEPHAIPHEHLVPERRPGLATQYGERRDSSITEVNFDRFDEDRPQAMLSLFYDDESGVESKTGRDADDATPGVFPVNGGAVEVSVVSSWDNPLPYLHANGRTFIIGDSSDRYAIRLTNHSRERFEVVASVDGLDVISGTEATLRHHGYILAPWSTLRIEGFRESMDSVRAFRFGEPSESYAVGRGFGRDIGVIGVALFGERTYRTPATAPNPFPGRFAPPPNY